VGSCLKKLKSLWSMTTGPTLAEMREEARRTSLAQWRAEQRAQFKGMDAQYHDMFVNGGQECFYCQALDDLEKREQEDGIVGWDRA
jgi:hypothetical protein